MKYCFKIIQTYNKNVEIEVQKMRHSRKSARNTKRVNLSSTQQMILTNMRFVLHIFLQHSRIINYQLSLVQEESQRRFNKSQTVPKRQMVKEIASCILFTMICLFCYVRTLKVLVSVLSKERKRKIDFQVLFGENNVIDKSFTATCSSASDRPTCLYNTPHASQHPVS